MPAYLNVETIRVAADIINKTLVTKGHTSEDLKFVSINWDDLIVDQPERHALEKLTVQETIYNNDKNVVNAIYSLLDEISRHNRQHEAANQVLAEKDAKIAKLQRNLARAESEASVFEKRLARLVHIDSPALTKQIEQLTKKNRTQSRELLRIRHLNTELQNKYEVEKRKMSSEVSELKTAILHSRGLSTTISYGRPMNIGNTQPSPKTRDLEVNPNLVHYNKPSINNIETPKLTPESEDTSTIAKREYDGIATQLSELIEKLMAENGKFAKLTRELTAYIEKVNATITPEQVRKENGPILINPVKAIDTMYITAETNDDVVPFENTLTPLLTSVYNNYEAISTLADMAVANVWQSASLSDNKLQDKMDKLENENKSLASSLQEALKALEEWRKHKNKS
ncbi:hypothetical protein JCM33374_g272 [Metschnikowia sp. JCM 33374]|nr:hypothetical protein JCM33374_g272 [Metschnikowia sp. JCM 33374]